jgi:hypothetical protein
MTHQGEGDLSRVLIVSALWAAIGCRVVSITDADLGRRVSAWQPDSVATVARRAYSGFHAPAQSVIADSASWSTAWERLYDGVRPKPPRPTVDFTTEVVVLAALGARPSGGYSIWIDSIVTFEAGAKVYVTALAPGSGCGVTLAFSQPVHLVRAVRPATPTLFEERSVDGDCR